MHWAKGLTFQSPKFVSMSCNHLKPLLPVQICYSPYCQSYNSYEASSENLVLDQIVIPKFIFFFSLITYLVDIVLLF